MNITVPIYQARHKGHQTWATLGLGPYTQVRNGRNPMKLRQSIEGALVSQATKMEPGQLVALEMTRRIKVVQARLTLTLRSEGKRRKFSGVFPLVHEPRWFNDDTQHVVIYHPLRQLEWFALNPDQPLETQAARYFQSVWGHIGADHLDDLRAPPKMALSSLSMTVWPKMLLDKLPDKKQGLWDDLNASAIKGQKPASQRRQGMKVLPGLGENLTRQAAAEHLNMGMVREPYRGHLRRVLCGSRKRSTILVGPSGSGKSVLLRRLVGDLLESDDYASHQNLDRVHSVWHLRGRGLVAGRAYGGDWGGRCVEVLGDVQRRPVVLWFDDLTSFGKLGQSRDSSRSLADFFRGPLSRGELLVVGEATPEQLQRLEEDAPSFAALLTQIQVHSTTHDQTLQLMIHETRQLERRHRVLFNPTTLQTALEMTTALLSGSSQPGAALAVMRRLAQEAQAQGDGQRPAPQTWLDPQTGVGPQKVVELMAQRTGLPKELLAPSAALDLEALRARFEARIAGQPQAITEMVQLIARIRAGLTDPGRPYGVFLFTGPTGTGKTALARTLASVLYSDPGRLVRLDMSEFSHPGAAARLIGDRWAPQGMLTQRLREQPFCVVLLDEIEKAHPSILNLLLQLFDEGRLTDASGKRADFTHAVVIMTSNLGARSQSPVGFFETPEGIMLDVQRAVEGFFAPELFNRIDRIVPFRPLTPQVAANVTRIAMTALLMRRGLTERHIFVEAHDSVIDEVVQAAFSPARGARALEQYLDTHIGGLLAEHITRSPNSSMQMIRLFSHGGQYKALAQSLGEMEPLMGQWFMEPLLKEPPKALQGRLGKALEGVEQIEDSQALEALSEALRHHLRQHNLGRSGHADKVYSLDTMRQSLKALRNRLEMLLESIPDEEDDPEMLEAQTFTRLSRSARYYRKPDEFQIFDPRYLAAPPAVVDRNSMLGALAQVSFLDRALKLVHDPQEHAVFIELLSMGHQGSEHSGALMTGLIRAYCDHRGKLEACAGWHTNGTLVEPPAEHALTLMRGFEHVMLKLVGLCVLDTYKDEEGCHLLQTLAQMPEVVRVRVWSAPPDEDVRTHLMAHREASTRFESALEAQLTPLPPDPSRLLPVVRTMRQEPLEGEESLVEWEDFLLGQTGSARVKGIEEALGPLWLLKQGGICS